MILDTDWKFYRLSYVTPCTLYEDNSVVRRWFRHGVECVYLSLTM